MREFLLVGSQQGYPKEILKFSSLDIFGEKYPIITGSNKKSSAVFVDKRNNKADNNFLVNLIRFYSINQLIN